MIVHATERLWLTADKKKVVRDGDPEASGGTLLCAPGSIIPERYLDMIPKGEAKREEPKAEPIEERSKKVPSGLSKRDKKKKGGA